MNLWPGPAAAAAAAVANDDDDDDDELVTESSEWGRFIPVLCSSDVTDTEFLTPGTTTHTVWHMS